MTKGTSMNEIVSIRDRVAAEPILFHVIETTGTVPEPKWMVSGTRSFDVAVRHQTTGNVINLPYFQGPAIDHFPDVTDIMDCLRIDAQAGLVTFEEFAVDFGFDAESRKAHATWEACVKTTADLRAFLGDEDLFQAWMYETEGL